MKILAIAEDKTVLNCLIHAINQAVPEAKIRELSEVNHVIKVMEEQRYDVVIMDTDSVFFSGGGGILLSREIMETYPNTNIIYTGYTPDYIEEAFKLHISGYLLKPVTVEKVKYELEDLRRPISENSASRLYVQCFGNFEVYVDRNLIHFTYKKTKEMLAYLVDRRGSRVTGEELIAILWEDDSGTKAAKSYLRNLWADLCSTFQAYELNDVLVKGRNSYAIRTENMECDYYEYQKGNKGPSFNGEYMSQYSWAEFQIGRLEGGL